MNKEKIKIKSRFYINSQPLRVELCLAIKDAPFHHLSSVLRSQVGDDISLFNEIDGEFLATITSLNKKEAQVELLSITKEPYINKFNIHLAFAPLKKDANDYALEKSCELGITEVTQVITQNTVNKPLDVDKINQKILQASQQCERLDIPKINVSSSLSKFLDIHKNKKIFWLYERSSEHTFSEYLQANIKENFNDIIILIGPEGGFSDAEVELLKSLDFITQVHLNTNILRAETACIVALVNFQVISCNF